MRRTLLALAGTLAAGSLVACAALTGLDHITEDDCAPSGCADAAGTRDAPAGDAAGDASPTRDSGPPPWEAAADTATDTAADAPGDAPADARSDGGEGDGGGRDANPGDDGSPDGVTGTDAPTGDASTADASGDASSDASPEASLDASLDGPTDASTHDASDAALGHDAADSGCGTVYVSEPFDANALGWSIDTTWSIAPTCASPPAPQKGHPDPTVDHTTGAVGGGVLAAYACGNNPTGTTAAARYVTSPAVDVSAAPALKLAFWRWLNSDAAGWMTSTVDVFDGTAWVNVYTNPSGSGNIVADAAWTRVEYDVTAYRSAAFRVRFGYAIASAGVYAMSCWNVDDVTLSTASCP